MMLLFDDLTRDRTDALRRGERLFDFYDARSGLPSISSAQW